MLAKLYPLVEIKVSNSIDKFDNLECGHEFTQLYGRDNYPQSQSKANSFNK